MTRGTRARAGAGARAAWIALLALSVSPAAQASTAPAEESPPTRRPNIVFVLADDLRFDTLGCTGNARVPTPHLDRLAEEGVLFTNATVPLALCRPSRATILTGRHSFAHGVQDNSADSDALLDDVIFPLLLQEAGFETAYIGKWHVPWPYGIALKGFDHWASFDGQGTYFDQALHVDGERAEASGHLTDQLTDLALAWLAERRAEQPFCLFFAVKNCHFPFRPPERHDGALAAVAFPAPASIDDAPASKLHALARTELGEVETPEKLERRTRAYHELVLGLDEAVGRLVEGLRERGLLDDTLIVFTSDHGLLLGEHGFTQKLRTYEPALRVPLILRLPGTFAGGAVETRAVSSLDLAPTLLELAGVEVPESVQGRSLTALRSERPIAPPWRTHTLHVAGLDAQSPELVELCVRGPRTKYTALTAEGFEELLFDLRADPEERRNLAPSAEHAELLREQRALLVELLEEAGAPLPVLLEAAVREAAAAR